MIRIIKVVKPNKPTRFAVSRWAQGELLITNCATVEVDATGHYVARRRHRYQEVSSITTKSLHMAARFALGY